MSLARALWEENRGLARTTLEHPFIRGLGDGTLPIESFRAYVAQDAFYLESFARAYALALAHASGRHSMSELAGLITGTLEELDLHDGYAAWWDVDLSNAHPTATTLAYTDFLLTTATLKGVGETCAAMTPCMRLYAYLGRSLADSGYSDENPYAEWIQTYADPGFEALAVRLESLLDRHAEDTPNIHTAYRRAMELELDFFEANARATG
jgi:thiaminase/transcriptional activator TenA